MSRFQFKGILSTILICCFIGAAATGLMMFFDPGGLVLGIPRYYVAKFHNVFSLIMIGGVVIHFILNSGIYGQEVDRLKKRK